MRLGVKVSLLLFAGYGVLVAVFAWGVDRWLRAFDAVITQETVGLLAREKGAEVSERMFEALQVADEVSQRRLRERIDDTVILSELLTSLSVVDGEGRVVAGGQTIRAEPLPLRPLFSGGEYVVYLPAVHDGRVLGYLRLTFHRAGVKDLYTGARHRLVAGAVVGLAGIGAMGALLQLRLTRRAAALTRVLDADANGGGADEAAFGSHDEFARALAAASRMRKALSEARQESSRLHQGFDALAQVTRVGVLLLGADALVEFANARALELLGTANTDGLRNGWPQTRRALAPILRGGRDEGSGGHAVTMEVAAASGPRPLRFEAYRLGGEGCDEHLVLVTDPQLLDTLEIDVRLASQLEGLARVYRTAAHELRAPLAAMMVNLDLRALLQELGALLAAQARRQQVEVILELPAEEAPLVGARDQLKQALLNVAVNALEAMPKGGQMRMELAMGGGRARVAISDTGRGIPAELLERIYESDFTTKGNGSGIGLYVARTLVHFHGGTIQAHSGEGRGTRVEVVLPIVPRS